MSQSSTLPTTTSATDSTATIATLTTGQNQMPSKSRTRKRKCKGKRKRSMYKDFLKSCLAPSDENLKKKQHLAKIAKNVGGGQFDKINKM